MTLVLLLDMDGPLADFDRHFFDVANAKGFRVDCDPSTQTCRFATDHVIDTQERNEMRRTINNTRWFRELPVTEGAFEGVERLLALQDAGEVEMWVVSKPLEANPFCRDDKAAWLSEHFPGLTGRLILAPDKSIVHGDILLDDAPHTEWMSRAHWTPVIFTAPWNGDGSKWGHLPFWDWDDDVDELLAHVRVSS